MMEARLFFESPTAKVYYDEGHDALFLEYVNNVKSHTDFVEIHVAVLEAFCQLNTQKFVADLRKMGAVGRDSQEWVEKILLPGMFTHLKGRPLHHALLLDPDEIFPLVSANNVAAKTENKIHEGFSIVKFTDAELLMKWLSLV